MAPRWFVIRNEHASAHPVLVRPRHAISHLRAPMTRLEITRARGGAELDVHSLESPGAREVIVAALFDDVTVPDDQPLDG
jgi:hypothetical protein